MEKTLILTSTKVRDYDRPGYDSDGYNSEVGILPRIMEEANRLQGPTNWLMRGLLSMHKKESA